jgi:hypothetical protein
MSSIIYGEGGGTSRRPTKQTDCWELDALSPEVVDGLLDNKVLPNLLSDGENLVNDERETERYSAEDHARNLSAGHGAQVHHVRPEGRPHRLRANGRNLQRHCGSIFMGGVAQADLYALDTLTSDREFVHNLLHALPDGFNG